MLMLSLNQTIDQLANSVHNLQFDASSGVEFFLIYHSGSSSKLYY